MSQRQRCVQVSSLWGLWIILLLAIFLAGVAGLVEYLLKRRNKDGDVDHINDRVQQIRRKMSGAVSMQRATSAFWSTLERSRASGTAGSGSQASPDIEAGARSEAPVFSEYLGLLQHVSDGYTPGVNTWPCKCPRAAKAANYRLIQLHSPRGLDICCLGSPSL